MLGKKIKQRIIVFIASIMLIFSFCEKGQASVFQDNYNSGISIGFTSMGDVDSISFNVTSNYIISSLNIICKNTADYKIEIKDSKFSIYENGAFKGQTNMNVILTPLNADSFIMFKKEGYTRRFSGSITFKRTGDKSFIPINSLSMEDYIKGVLPFEVGNDFPLEALKAQAVAARTYALSNKDKFSSYGYDLTDDIYSQVYRGYVLAAENCNKAVDQTKGKVLMYGGNPINAYFSSSNGGYTERNDYVWSGSQLPYLIEDEDPYDTNNRNWVEERTQSEIDALLKSKYPDLNVKQFIKIDMGNIKNYPSGRVSELSIIYVDNNDMQQTLILTKDKNRNFFGLKSSLYTLTVKKDSSNRDVYTFCGNGYGHGIGLSQWGAYGRAQNGQDYASILSFYYRNSVLASLANFNSIAYLASRLGGLNRFQTSVIIAENTFSSSINSVVIASGNDFPDALSGSILAKRLNSPLLIVNDNVNTNIEVLEYIKNNLDVNGSIYILGGKGSVSDEFINKFKSMGYNENKITRIGGKDRNETSLFVAKALDASTGTPVVIATGEDFPDSLSISSAAAKNGWPILLVNKNTVNSDIKNYISDLKPSKIYIAGGTGVVSDSVASEIKNAALVSEDKVIRLGGSNRYETSRLINNAFYSSTEEIVVTSGKDFPDALSGSVYAAKSSAPIVLIDPNEVSSAQNYIKFLGQGSSNIKLIILGLQGAVSDNTVSCLTNITK